MPSKKKNQTPAESRTWFEFVAAKGDTPAEVLIYDYIGAYGVTAVDFDAALKALGPQANLNMRVNSPGGETTTAASIYNMLQRYKAKNNTTLTVIIDGLAASSASWIAMLGDEIIMPENTLMMIHDPSGVVVGSAKEMRAIAAVLDRIKQGMVSAYVTKSGKTPIEVATIMSEETWYSAEEAVAEGFADRVDNPIDIAASFDLSRFKNPPDAPVVGSSAPVSAAKEDGHMTTKPNQQAETAAEMEARIRAEIAAEAPPAASAAPAPAAAETPEAMEARIRASIAGTNAEISSLCTIAGKPELAASFIAANKSVADVRKELEAAAKASPASASAAPGVSVNTHVGAGDLKADADAVKALTSKPIDASAIFKNFNKGGKGTPVQYMQ